VRKEATPFVPGEMVNSPVAVPKRRSASDGTFTARGNDGGETQ